MSGWMAGSFRCLAYVLLWELFILFVYLFVENEKCHSLVCQLLSLKSSDARGNMKIFYYVVGLFGRHLESWFSYSLSGMVWHGMMGK